VSTQLLLQSVLQGTRDLPGFREASALLLGEQQVVAQGDFEAASGAFDELRLEAEPLLDLVRQTGGTRVVVSDGAVLDGQMSGHDAPPFSPDYRGDREGPGETLLP